MKLLLAAALVLAIAAPATAQVAEPKTDEGRIYREPDTLIPERTAPRSRGPNRAEFACSLLTPTDENRNMTKDERTEACMKHLETDKRRQLDGPQPYRPGTDGGRLYPLGQQAL